MSIVSFFCWAVVVALLAAFVLTLADKWRVDGMSIRGWLQVHAPNDFFNQLFSCNFCCCWWLSVVICITLLVVIGHWQILAVPLISTLIARKFYENR